MSKSNNKKSTKMNNLENKQQLEKSKYEIANEFQSSNANNNANKSVGGEVIKHLVDNGINNNSSNANNIQSN